jgi:hypothetical protein
VRAEHDHPARRLLVLEQRADDVTERLIARTHNPLGAHRIGEHAKDAAGLFEQFLLLGRKAALDHVEERAVAMGELACERHGLLAAVCVVEHDVRVRLALVAERFEHAHREIVDDVLARRRRERTRLVEAAEQVRLQRTQS